MLGTNQHINQSVLSLKARKKERNQKNPCCDENKLVIIFWGQNRTILFINVLWFFWITPVLFIASFQHCFFVIELLFLPTQSIRHHFLCACLFTIPNIYPIRVKDKTCWWKWPLKTNDNSRHKHLTHQINKIIKLHKRPCHSARVPAVFHLVYLAARGPLSCWEMRGG